MKPAPEMWSSSRERCRDASTAARLLLCTMLPLAAVTGCGPSEKAETPSPAEMAAPEPGATSEKASVPAAEARSEPKPRATVTRQFEQQREAAAPGQWLLYGGNPVLARGEIDQWDDFSVGSPAVIEDGDGYRMWYRGCHVFGLEQTCAIGHAISADGIAWIKSPGPVFVPLDAHESARLNSLALVRADDRYLMWYSVDADRSVKRPYATLHLIESADGLHWESQGLVLRAFSQYKSPIMHAALYDGEVFHLWYADFPSGDENEKLMHLTSSDGKTWQVAGTSSLKSLGLHPGSLSVWRDTTNTYRAFFSRPFASPRWPRSDQRNHGLFGRLASSDGNGWRQVPGAEVLPRALGDESFAAAPAAIHLPGESWLWFAIRDESGAESIGLAWARDEEDP